MFDLLIKFFVKDSQSLSEFRRRELYGQFAGIIGLASNLLLFLLKITVGLFSNSIAIIADAVNNFSDFGSSLITLIGFKLSSKPADAEHPYGHARMEYISGMIVSILIVFLALQLIKSSINKIINPQLAEFSFITVAILFFSIFLKLWQSLFYRKIANLIDSPTLLAASADSRNDVVATIAILVAAIISSLTGYNLDGFLGLVVALFILISGVKLVIETGNPLLGTVPSKELVDSIYEKILSYDGIIGLHDLIVHNYGVDKCFASVHCEVCAEQDIMVSHDLIDNIERDFLEKHGIHLVIHLDPVVTNDERTNKLKAEVEKIIEEISPKISMHDFRVVWGVSHSNLIFDVVVPFNFEWEDEELIEHIRNKVYQINPTYHSVIRIDHHYV
ncbi:MAG TPA: cation transporter [Clostridia bacterium]|nr:cation transporter [Clostridia bacterium]